jgi:hypothetical protein
MIDVLRARRLCAKAVYIERCHSTIINLPTVRGLGAPDIRLRIGARQGCPGLVLFATLRGSLPLPEDLVGKAGVGARVGSGRTDSEELSLKMELH